MSKENLSLEFHIKRFESFLTKATEKFFKDIKEPLNFKGNSKYFDFYKELGSGNFAVVYLARFRETKKFYALRTMAKKRLVETQQLGHLMTEIYLMNYIDFPFLLSMYSCFMDNTYIYMCMDYCPAEMFDVLRSHRMFTEPVAQFYAAQVMLGLEYLHALGFIYRDLKPENIVYSSDGYIKITDFGFAKLIKQGRTYTMCGTPEYIAPEIILNKGYTMTVDWWSFGILIYEMCAGQAPFTARDDMKLFEKIVKCKFTTPTHFSEDLISICNGLIQGDRTRRLGGLKEGSKDIKRHSWFKNMDFDNLLKKKIKPPLMPSMKSPPKRPEMNPIFPVKVDSVDKFAKDFEKAVDKGFVVK